MAITSERLRQTFSEGGAQEIYQEVRAEGDFLGIFDGDGHTLTFNYGSSSQPFNEEYCAPFRYTNGAIFKDLCVGGTIYTSQKYAAGIVSNASDSTAITNCDSRCHYSHSIHNRWQRWPPTQGTACPTQRIPTLDSAW
ncbi:MAG: hypothetical protein K6F96_04915 [Bacteroidales bacterium]|nr:hypothetical protein [Bacteroidales bacterium]